MEFTSILEKIPAIIIWKEEAKPWKANIDTETEDDAGQSKRKLVGKERRLII